jgi:hypothetical protein
MNRFFIFFFILFPFLLQSQDTTKTGRMRNWDTLKYQKFDYVLIVGVFQQHRDFSNNFEQQIYHARPLSDTAMNSKHTYYAESRLITGIVLNYDKFQLSFATRSKPPEASLGKGYTKTFNIGLNFGDNRWISENYYRWFEGFYDKNTPDYDTAFKRTGNYYQLPGLRSSLFMTRLLYFTNYEKYSFQSGFGCNYRQLKSAATWILGGSYNTYRLQNDSSVFPVKSRPFFNDYGGLKGFVSHNLAVNFGAAGTLVLFKAWFIGGYFTVGPEMQIRNYNFGENTRNLTYVSWSGTGRFSMGLNMKKFYLLFSTSDDYNLFNSPNIINFTSESITVNFSFGWRFHTGTPKLYRKFMDTKLYKIF